VTDHGMRGGIIAAGEGSRLRRDGWAIPKALVPVAGVPLIESVIRNFERADIRTLTIIVNDRDARAVTHVRDRFPHLSLEFIVKTTASSFESFAEVAAAGGSGRMLVSTVDAWCGPAEFAGFAERASRRPDRSMVLGITALVADERPLWVDVDRDGRVTDIGGAPGAFVTAGLYMVPEHLRRMAPPHRVGRLREFLAWVHRAGHPMYGEAMTTVVDVDRAEDVALAESLARAASPGPAGPSGSIQG
jgi:NDP-sugar pyrophosphorylase family protein